MTTRRLLGRRPSTPVRTSVSSRPGQTLPNDMFGQTCRRVGTVSVVFASLWIIALLLNNVVTRWLGEMLFMRELWPYPGNIEAVPASWTDERAHRWWDRHHPESLGMQSPDGDRRLLTKTMDIGWTPIETSAPTAR